jgi:hypothetical protein
MVLVVDGELTFPIPIELAIFVIDPNTPEVVETVIVEEYDT